MGYWKMLAARKRNSNRTCPIPGLNKQVGSSDGSPGELLQLHYLFGVQTGAADVYVFITLRCTDKVGLDVLSALTGCVHRKRAASGTACVEPHEDLESFAKSA